MTALRSTQIPVSDPSSGLRITEIFYSLQGEALTSGLPTIFIRLTGCPLRCVYCDTTYSFSGGERHSLDGIMTIIAKYPCQRVCVTGGEPLAQPNCHTLMERLLSAGYEVSLETAGALPVRDVPNAVSKVMDIKTPSSGEVDKNLWENIDYLTCNDQVKFVIMNREDYDWSKRILTQYQLADKVATVWFSPMFSVDDESVDYDVDSPTINDGNHKADERRMTDRHAASPTVPKLARELAEWILADGLPVRFQLQLHKLIWADAKGK